MNELTCNPDRLASFVNGELGVDDEQNLTAHLDECESCGTALEHCVADIDAWREAGELLGGSDVPEIAQSVADGQLPVQIDQVLESLNPTDDPESLGRIGSYEVTGVIGSGGMGVVLKAHERSLDRVVAIKVMAPHLASSGSARKRFAREAKAAAAVIHPNVMAIHRVSNDGRLPYLVMPFVGGDSLQRRLDQDGPLPLVEVLRVGSQIAAGLAAAHGQGLVHRDIKPANILLDGGVERVSLTDFGLARAVDDASMTRTGVIAGTPQYMSPEQARGDAIDHRSDLFSLGSVLYAMCTGHVPFRAETSYGVLRRITDDVPRSIREINPDTPEWLEGAIMKLLAKSADDRFDAAEQVAEILKDCLAHVQQPTIAPLPKSVTVLTAPMKRFSILIGLLAVAVAAMLVLAGVTIIQKLNMGTLTINCTADDIPIRISQGDKLVEELTVSRKGTSVRIAAGKYVVEIDGEFTDLSVNDGVVSLKRGETEVVTIVKNNGGDAGDVKHAVDAGTDRRSPRAVVSAYMKAVVAGDVEAASSLAVHYPAKLEQIEAWAAEMGSVRIQSTHLDGRAPHRLAAVVTTPYHDNSLPRSEEENVGLHIAFELEVLKQKWTITAIDMWTTPAIERSVSGVLRGYGLLEPDSVDHEDSQGALSQQAPTELTTANLLDGTWDIELHDPQKPKRSGFASFKEGIGMIASTDDQTEPMRFRFKVQPQDDGQLLLSMAATSGAANGGPSNWYGIVEVNGEEGELCFARDDKIDENVLPGSCRDADPDVYSKVVLKRKTSGTNRFDAANAEATSRKYQFTTNSAVRILERSPDGQWIAVVMNPPDWVVQNNAWASWEPSIQILSVQQLKRARDSLWTGLNAPQPLHKHLFRSIRPISREYTLFRSEARHQLSIQSIAFSRSGRMLAVSTRAGHIVVVNVETGERVRSLDTRKWRLDATDFLAGSPRGFIAPEVKSHAFSPDGLSLVVSGSALAGSSTDLTLENSFGALTLWDINTGKQTRDLAGNAVRHYLPESVAFSPDGKTIASAGRRIAKDDPAESKAILLWDVESGKQTGTLKAFKGEDVPSMAFSPDGNFVAVTAVQYHSDRLQVATTSLLGVDDDKMQWHHTHANPEQLIGNYDVQFADDEKFVYAVEPGGTIQHIDVASGLVVKTQKPPQRTSWKCFAALPNRAIAVGGQIRESSSNAASGSIELFFEDQAWQPVSVGDALPIEGSENPFKPLIETDTPSRTLPPPGPRR